MIRMYSLLKVKMLLLYEEIDKYDNKPKKKIESIFLNILLKLKPSSQIIYIKKED